MSLRSLLDNWMRRRGAPGGGAGAPDGPEGGERQLRQLLDEGLRNGEAGDLAGAARCFSRAAELQHDSAEAHRLLGRVHREQGNLEDAADCFELASHFAPDMVEAWIDLAAALRGLGRLDEAEAACRRAAELAPWLPEAQSELANLAKSRGDLEGAIAGYHDALRLRPDFVPALCNLGYTLHALGRFAEAQRELEQALSQDPLLAEAHHNLGLALREQGRPAQALACFERALELRPNLIETRAAAAHCLRDLGQLNEAIAAYGDVLAGKPDFGDAVINRCYAYLQNGEYVAGWAEYERRFAATQTSPRYFPYPLWRGEPLAGRTLLVYAEQGLGDEIMFASCLPDVLAHAGRCVIECNARLAPIFGRSFPAAVIHGGAKGDAVDWLSGVPPIDCQLPIGSLPRHVRATAGAFPRHAGYLRADPVAVERWRSRLARAGNGLKVGLSWRGGTPATRGLLRSIPLEMLAAAVGGSGATLICVQYGDIAADIVRANAANGVKVYDLLDDNHDMDESAALISALDLVVSVDNTVVHLAGALGRPVWVLLSASPEWRYPRTGAAMPWYPSARLFRQPRAGDWNSVLAEVRSALAKAPRAD